MSEKISMAEKMGYKSPFGDKSLFFRKENNENYLLQVTIFKNSMSFKETLTFEINTNLPKGEKVILFLKDTKSLFSLFPNDKDSILFQTQLIITEQNNLFYLVLNEKMEEKALLSSGLFNVFCYLKIESTKIKDAYSKIFNVYRTVQLKTQTECLCKKSTLTEENVKFIVKGIRKGQIIGKRTIKDKNKNSSWIDKDGNIISSTDRGKKPIEAIRLNQVDFTKYEDIDSRGNVIGDRLFYLTDSLENINLKEANYSEFTKWLNTAINELSLNSCVRKVHFFTQIFHETQQFGSSYENNESAIYGGGNFYQGRGFLQITHDFNYLEYYDYLNNTQLLKQYQAKRSNEKETVEEYFIRTNDNSFAKNFIAEFKAFVQSLASSMKMAMKSAIWYWEKEGINKYADLDEIDKVSAAVNFPARLKSKVFNSTGIRGLNDRKIYYAIFKKMFDDENCK